MKAQRTALATITALVLASVAMQAQWVGRPTPGIPRTPDGKPNLTAPAPPKLADGHPDLSGIWDVGNMNLLPRSGPGPEGRRRAAADAVGGRPSEGTTGSQSRRRSVYLLHAIGRAS